MISETRSNPRKVPIRHCSRWGLPCGGCYQPPGGLLPHRFTLTVEPARQGPARRRFVFCGAFRRVAPPGRYPAPLPFGVRTFLAPLRARGHPALRASLALRLHPRCVNPHSNLKQLPRQRRQHPQQPVAKDGHPRIRPSRAPAVRCRTCESAAALSRQGQPQR